MSDVVLTRREVLETAGWLGAGAVALGVPAGGAMAADTAPKPPAYRGEHVPKPLPFDPTKLKGLSEKLLVSHHDNNYGGAAKNLAKVQDELSRVNKDTPGPVVFGLR